MKRHGSREDHRTDNPCANPVPAPCDSQFIEFRRHIVDARNLQANVVLDDASMMSLPDLEMRYAGRRINRMIDVNEGCANCAGRDSCTRCVQLYFITYPYGMQRLSSAKTCRICVFGFDIWCFEGRTNGTQRPILGSQVEALSTTLNLHLFNSAIPVLGTLHSLVSGSSPPESCH